MCGTQERIPKALMYVELGLCDRNLLTILGLIMNVIEKLIRPFLKNEGQIVHASLEKYQEIDHGHLTLIY
jgi:hypothetical protein